MSPPPGFLDLATALKSCTTKPEIIILDYTMFMLTVSPCKKAKRGKIIAETYLCIKNPYSVTSVLFGTFLLGKKNAGGIFLFITW